MELARTFALAALFFAVSVAAAPYSRSYAFPNGPCGKQSLRVRKAPRWRAIAPRIGVTRFHALADWYQASSWFQSL
jgi:hypothetical protein